MNTSNVERLMNFVVIHVLTLIDLPDAKSAILFLGVFPDLVLGSSGTRKTILKAATAPISFRTMAMISWLVLASSMGSFLET